MALAGIERTALETALTVPGGLAALAGLYLALLSLAALVWLRRPRPAPQRRPRSRLAVVVPAHDEERLIGRSVASLRAQSYPRELYEVVVVADNCTDGTASAARAAGARVLERRDPDARGKGRALRFAFDRLVAEPNPPDAIVVVDADTAAAPDFLERLAERFEAGAPVVQGESLLAVESSPGAILRAAAFLLVNRVRPAGRAALGLPTALGGNGMLLDRRALAAVPWEAYTSAEDVEYSLALAAAGIRVAFASGALVWSPPAPDRAAAAQQELRWEGGKLHLARAWLPRLLARALRARQPWLLETALALAVPPLGYLASAAAAGLAASAALAACSLAAAVTVIPWAVACAAIALHVLAGLRAAEAPRAVYRALLWAPLFLAAKLARSHRLVGFRADSWVRTARAGEARQAGERAGAARPREQAGVLGRAPERGKSASKFGGKT